MGSEGEASVLFPLVPHLTQQVEWVQETLLRFGDSLRILQHRNKLILNAKHDCPISIEIYQDKPL